MSKQAEDYLTGLGYVEHEGNVTKDYANSIDLEDLAQLLEDYRRHASKSRIPTPLPRPRHTSDGLVGDGTGFIDDQKEGSEALRPSPEQSKIDAIYNHIKKAEFDTGKLFQWVNSLNECNQSPDGTEIIEIPNNLSPEAEVVAKAIKHLNNNLYEVSKNSAL